MISTKPGLRLPVRTSRRWTTLSCTTNTYALPRSGTMASSGTSNVGESSAFSETVRNIPWRNMPSEFASSARTAMERVTGSTRESMFVTTPVNTRSGNPVARAATGRPRRTMNSIVSGTVKSSLMVEVSSSVLMTVPGLT